MSGVEGDYVRIFDTTCRDGEQSPGATMTRAEKLRIVKALEGLGVDVIEAGFPAASPGEVSAVREISATVETCEVAALCRTREGDIDAAWSAVKDAVKPRLHVFIATSDIHLEHKLKMTRDEVLAQIAQGVSACRSLTSRVEFSAEDATRSEAGFLREAMACAVEHGATILNVPDTVGYTTPVEYGKIISSIVELTEGTDAIVACHCHNDLGLAVANSLAAILAGARQVEGCINGIGERAGNAALEEVIMALRTRRDVFGIETRADSTKLLALSKLVSRITGIPVQPNKAIIGKNAFAHEAGIHQHGVLNERTTYEIMAPEDVGFNESSLVLGKHSGRHALRDRLKELGYALSDEELNRVFTSFKELADKKKDIYDPDLHALVANTVLNVEDYYELLNIEFTSGNEVTPHARAKLRAGSDVVEAECDGDGPVNAVVEAIKVASGLESVSLKDYSISAITGGSDAQGRVNVRVDKGGEIAQGQSTHTDVVVASAQAFVCALNHLVYQEELKRRAEGSKNGYKTPSEMGAP
ncbi:MAG: 2-isopropylmalate synthase [Myxococcota bacterium]|nr:2-isopropylmalate synthase [Myxococcota bacterium]